jgi:hypothetical protein
MTHALYAREKNLGVKLRKEIQKKIMRDLGKGKEIEIRNEKLGTRIEREKGKGIGSETGIGREIGRGTGIGREKENGSGKEKGRGTELVKRKGRGSEIGRDLHHLNLYVLL